MVSFINWLLPKSNYQVKKYRLSFKLNLVVSGITIHLKPSLTLKKIALGMAEQILGDLGINLKFRFFSRLVGESLVNFQRKVSQIMKSVSFTFNDFNFVIHTF